MGKICTLLKNKDVGSIGIGAMIVFIAMVLVAGIAASVLIQTSTKLESQAMHTGSQTTEEVATGLAIMNIEGHKQDATDIDDIAIMVRCRAGSKNIDLAETIIEISDSDTKNFLTYDDGGLADYIGKDDINGDVFTAGHYPDDAVNFSIIVLEDADDSCSAAGTVVINSGDMVVLGVACDLAFAGLETRTEVWGLVIPEHGSPGVIDFTCPASYSKTVMELQ